MKRRLLIALAILVGLAGIALARPGGGGSYSGGGGHSYSGGGRSGGGGGGGQAIFELVYWVIRLIIYFPQIGVPLVLIVVGFIGYSAYKQHKNKDWDSGPPVTLKSTASLEPVRDVDPDFSRVLFEDFAFRLFSTAYRASTTPETLATVAPYVSQGARDSILARGLGPVETVVIGAMRAYRVDVPSEPATEGGPPRRVHIGVEFEANVSTRDATYYSVENWVYSRDATRRTKPPGATKGFPCPNCGAPWQASATGTQVCASCGEVVDNGRFDWIVDQVWILSSDKRPPTVTEEVPERGTDLPTYRAPDVQEQWASLETDDPAVTEQNLVARLDMIYKTLNNAWANNELSPVRGLVSDGLFDYLQYWVETYKKQGLRNALDDMGITATLVAQVTRDRWYDAVTIRLWAQGKDYVVRSDSGKVVRGSKHRIRPYSEYWTLIRAKSKKGAPVARPECSNCGAPLNITMAGACEHCGAHLTAGEFDWVLSKIEQDDSYRG